MLYELLNNLVSNDLILVSVEVQAIHSYNYVQ